MREQYLMRLPKNQKELLQEIAKAKGLTLNGLLMMILDDYIKLNYKR